MELELLNTNRWIVRTRGEIRTTDAFRRILQFRAVGDVRFSVAPHFTLVSQLHLVDSRNSSNWDESNRLMAGFELPFRGDNRNFTSRTLVERMWMPRGVIYQRYRERLALRWTRVPLQPQVQEELMTDSLGWAASRQTFTVLVPISKRVELDMGYHFEFRPSRLGGNRQMVYTYFRVKRQPR